ncbi:unnamed protein product [Symbiodinium sp. CCMP2592]|nr:unnamed protein product [Symbiodinium sp. CCMP2592]
MLHLLEELVTSNIPSMPKINCCMGSLGLVLRSLSKRQRQKLAPLMVQLLIHENISGKVDNTTVVWRLKLLWLADEDPTENYAEAQQLLRSLEKSHEELRPDVRVLLHCS